MTATTAVPTSQSAIVAGDDLDFHVSHEMPLPPLGPDEILIKTAAVALNPVDSKLVSDFVTPGCIFGFDCAGTVVAVGHQVRKSIQVGDRVCGAAAGMNRAKPLASAFAQYVVMSGDFALKIPDPMSLEDAAALGTAVASACMALFWSLRLPVSWLETPAPAPAPSILVYGGSTSTGTMVIQLLNLCGVNVLTTCSPHNFKLVKSYGASAVWDYRSSDCAKDIRAEQDDELEYAIDCVAEDSTMRFCYAAIGRAGGSYTALNPFNELMATRKAIEPDWILATRITGAGSDWPAPYQCEPEPKLAELAGPLFDRIQTLLDQGKIKPHPIDVAGAGFSEALEGLRKLRTGTISGKKLVYRIC